MIILDATTKKLQIVLAGAITTSQLDVVSTYVDVTTTAGVPSGFVSGETDTTSNSTTPVDIVAAPAASTQRQVKLINIPNTDTNPATVIVRYNNNATIRKLVTVTLAVGSTLQYTDGEGWRVLDTEGALLSGAASTDAGLLARTVVLTDNDIQNLPSTPFTLVPAPGAAFYLQFVMAIAKSSFITGYTVNNDAFMEIDLVEAESNYLINNTTTTPVRTDLDTFLSTGSRRVLFVPQTLTVDPASDEWGNIGYPRSVGANTALTLFGDNSGTGDYTGGNAANTLTVTTYYVVRPV